MILEVFEWASAAAIEEAHAKLRVQQLRARFAQCCDYVPINAVMETADFFAEFEPVDLNLPPIVQPAVDQRAE